jgi:hypothetical protein
MHGCKKTKLVSFLYLCTCTILYIVHMKRKPTAHEEASDATLQQQVSTTTCRATGDTVSLFLYLFLSNAFIVCQLVDFLCLLSLKCLCRFLSVGGFSFLPLSFLVWLRFQLICRTKMLTKSDPANIHSSSFLCRFIVFIHNYLKTIFSIIFFSF